MCRLFQLVFISWSVLYFLSLVTKNYPFIQKRINLNFKVWENGHMSIQMLLVKSQVYITKRCSVSLFHYLLKLPRDKRLSPQVLAVTSQIIINYYIWLTLNSFHSSQSTFRVGKLHKAQNRSLVSTLRFTCWSND